MIFNSDLIYIGVHQRWGNNLNLSLEVAFILTLKCSSGSSDRVEVRGQETWNLCGRIQRPSFLWLIFTVPGGGHGPLAPPGSATEMYGFRSWWWVAVSYADRMELLWIERSTWSTVPHRISWQQIWIPVPPSTPFHRQEIRMFYLLVKCERFP